MPVASEFLFVLGQRDRWPAATRSTSPPRARAMVAQMYCELGAHLEGEHRRAAVARRERRRSAPPSRGCASGSSSEGAAARARRSSGRTAAMAQATGTRAPSSA